MVQRNSNLLYSKFSPGSHLLKEKGAVTFVILSVVIPLLFFSFYLLLDISLFVKEERVVQEKIDQATVVAYKQMPYVEKTKQVLESRLAGTIPELKESKQSPVVMTNSGTVEVFVPPFSTAKSGFAGFFTSEENAVLKHTAKSVVATNAHDIMINFSVSAEDMAPSLLGDDAWGNAALWPAALDVDSLKGRFSGSREVNPRVLTQQCFNPYFSGIKRGVLRAYQYFSNFPQDFVSVGVYPAQSPPDLPISPSATKIEMLRALQPRPDFRIQANPQVPLTDLSETSVFPYDRAIYKDALCAGISEREVKGSNLSIPQLDSTLSLWKPNSTSILPTQYVLDLKSPKFTEGASLNLSMPEAITFKSVRGEPKPEFSSVIGDSMLFMLQGVAQDKSNPTDMIRHKTGFIVISSLPLVDGSPWDGDITKLSAFVKATKIRTGIVKCILDTSGDGAENKETYGYLSTLDDLSKCKSIETLSLESTKALYRSMKFILLFIDNPYTKAGALGAPAKKFATLFESSKLMEELPFSIQVLYFESPEKFTKDFSPALFTAGRTPHLVE